MYALGECTFSYSGGSGVVVATAVFHVDGGLVVADFEELLTELAGKLMKAFGSGAKAHRGTGYGIMIRDYDTGL